MVLDTVSRSLGTRWDPPGPVLALFPVNPGVETTSPSILSALGLPSYLIRGIPSTSAFPASSSKVSSQALGSIGHPCLLAFSPGYHHSSPLVMSCKHRAEAPGMCISTQQGTTGAGLSSAKKGFVENWGWGGIIGQRLQGRKMPQRSMLQPSQGILWLQDQHCYQKASTPPPASLTGLIDSGCTDL